jgi:hypothetical protein
VREDLDKLFPGCQVRDGWELEADRRDRQLFTPKDLEILEFIWFRFRTGADSLSFPEIYKSIGMQQQNFSRSMKSKELRREIEHMGLVIESGNRRKPGMIVRAESRPSASVNHGAKAVTAIPHRSGDFSWRRPSKDARGIPVEKLPHSCGSSDALQVFRQEDGSFDGYCFACGTFVRDPYSDKPKDYEPRVRVKSPQEIAEEMAEAKGCPVMDLPDRGLRADSFAHFGVTIGVSEQDGVTPTLHHYPYTVDGQVKAYKVRLIKEKRLWTIGSMHGVNMFGWPQALESSSSTLYITEGELDAVSLWQALQDNGKDVAVVSLSRGAGGVRRDLEQHRTAIADRFDKVVLVFDQDGAGQTAAGTAQTMLPNAIAIKLPEKDANACLTTGKAQALYEAAAGPGGLD